MRRLLFGLSSLACVVIAARAEAHFKLVYPPSWTNDNALGDPQKVSPCGGEGAMPNGVVTRFRPGETITVRWEETIYHPGHWRIAFTADRSQLRDPIVTVDQNRNAVSATIDDPPVAPVLLDRLFPRSGAGNEQTFEQAVTLPNITCEKCTLQVIQFMEGHGPPQYLYYHCADIELAGDPVDGGPMPDLGVSNDSGAGPPDTGLIAPTYVTRCACDHLARSRELDPSVAAALLLLLLVGRRRVLAQGARSGASSSSASSSTSSSRRQVEAWIS